MRKNILRFFPLALMIVFLLFFTAIVQAETMKIRVIKNANVRLKPTTESPILATMPAGSILNSLGKFDAWFKVNLPPDDQGIILSGYIWEDLVEAIVESVSPQAPQTITAPPPPPASAKQQPVYQPYSQPAAGSGLSFGLKLSGGMNYLSMADPNANLQGWTDFFTDIADPIPFVSMTGGFGSIHWGMNFEGDIIILFNNSFGIAFGAGFIQGKHGTDDSVDFTSIFGDETITDEMTVSAIPLRFGLYVFLPMTPGAKVFLNAGGGYYLAKWTSAWRDEWNGNWETMNQEATAGGIGFHGGLGVIVDLTQNIALTIEGQGRYAKITGFEGTINIEDDTGWTFSDAGPLWYLEFQGPSNWYPQMRIDDTEPSVMGVRNVREAALDFTGFAAKIGVLIRF